MKCKNCGKRVKNNDELCVDCKAAAYDAAQKNAPKVPKIPLPNIPLPKAPKIPVPPFVPKPNVPLPFETEEIKVKKPRPAGLLPGLFGFLCAIAAMVGSIGALAGAWVEVFGSSGNLAGISAGCAGAAVVLAIVGFAVGAHGKKTRGASRGGAIAFGVIAMILSFAALVMALVAGIIAAIGG